MHLEEKDACTPGHEPKVIPEAIILSTVAQHSAVRHLAEKDAFTPRHEPKVIPDDIIIETVEQQSAVRHLEENKHTTTTGEQAYRINGSRGEGVSLGESNSGTH